MSEELLSPSQAAEMAKCHNDTIRRAIEVGFLPAQRVGRNWIIRRSDVEIWIKEGRQNRKRGKISESENPAKQTKNYKDN